MSTHHEDAFAFEVDERDAAAAGDIADRPTLAEVLADEKPEYPGHPTCEWCGVRGATRGDGVCWRCWQAEHNDDPWGESA